MTLWEGANFNYVAKPTSLLQGSAHIVFIWMPHSCPNWPYMVNRSSVLQLPVGLCTCNDLVCISGFSNFLVRRPPSIPDCAGWFPPSSEGYIFGLFNNCWHQPQFNGRQFLETEIFMIFRCSFHPLSNKVHH